MAAKRKAEHDGAWRGARSPFSPSSSRDGAGAGAASQFAGTKTNRHAVASAAVTVPQSRARTSRTRTSPRSCGSWRTTRRCAVAPCGISDGRAERGGALARRLRALTRRSATSTRATSTARRRTRLRSWATASSAAPRRRSWCASQFHAHSRTPTPRSPGLAKRLARRSTSSSKQGTCASWTRWADASMRCAQRGRSATTPTVRPSSC